MKKRIILILAILLSISFLGCTNQLQKEPPQTITSTKPSITPSISSTYTESPPREPISIEASFPDSAPPLNQTAELIVTIKTPYLNLKDIELKVGLPEALELVNGQLTWHGDIPLHSETIVVTATVRALKVGSWTIGVTTNIDPDINGGFGGTGFNPIYILISEKSSQWRRYPAYPSPGVPTYPPGQAPATSYTPK